MYPYHGTESHFIHLRTVSEQRVAVNTAKVAFHDSLLHADNSRAGQAPASGQGAMIETASSICRCRSGWLRALGCHVAHRPADVALDRVGGRRLATLKDEMKFHKLKSSNGQRPCVDSATSSSQLQMPVASTLRPRRRPCGTGEPGDAAFVEGNTKSVFFFCALGAAKTTTRSPFGRLARRSKYIALQEK